jgi:hypothetical protein
MQRGAEILYQLRLQLRRRLQPKNRQELLHKTSPTHPHCIQATLLARLKKRQALPEKEMTAESPTAAAGTAAVPDQRN